MPSVYDYRHIELDRVGAGKKSRASIRHQHEDTQSRLFGASPPSTPSRKFSTESLQSMSPGRIIKQNQMRSNIFPTETQSNGGHSSSSSSLDLTDSASIASAPAPLTPRKLSTASLVATPGRIIKQKHQTSNVFPTVETPTHTYHGQSYSSSVDLTDSASPPPTTP